MKLTQAEKAHLALKRAIVKGEIPDGAFLVEGEIMRRYGIGRTPYREACNRLCQDGLLTLVPRRGYMIPEISFRTVCDLFEMRLILEETIAQLAAVRANETDLADLDYLANKPLAGGPPAREFAELIQANTDFHLRLAKATHNRELVETLTRNLEKTERLMYIELGSFAFGRAEFRLQHTHIVRALRSRDPLAVRDAVLEDIMQAQRTTVAYAKRAPTVLLREGANRAAEAAAKPEGDAETAPGTHRPDRH